jgi:2-methylisocitrate lyase-like PEP mutase family enzyme
MPSQADKLRALLAQDKLNVMPCCFDALSAKLIEQAGFDLTFMSGFATSASRIGQPDLGLMSYAEVLDQARNITDAIQIPLIADGDTGYGNAMNVRRTVTGFAKAGAAAVMIEDQLAPKRCGHTPGKAVVSRAEAFDRIRAAQDAKDAGADILILARTDARHDHGLPKRSTGLQSSRSSEPTSFLSRRQRRSRRCKPSAVNFQVQKWPISLKAAKRRSSPTRNWKT